MMVTVYKVDFTPLITFTYSLNSTIINFSLKHFARHVSSNNNCINNKIFASVSKETPLILVKRLFGNEWGNICKKTFVGLFLKQQQEGRREKQNYKDNYKAFLLHADAKRK